MLKYLIVQLCDSSPSFCHYPDRRLEPRLISPGTLGLAVCEAMKENLTLQVVWPGYVVPDEYKKILGRLDRADIVPAVCEDKPLLAGADVVVMNGMTELAGFECRPGQAYVLRLSWHELLGGGSELAACLRRLDRLSVVVTDLLSFRDAMQESYASLLSELSLVVKAEYVGGHHVQLNLLTDRILLGSMNNCEAGHESLALAPDGRYYVCPAFYGEGTCVAGSVSGGVNIRNPQLYRLDHAPICGMCDAWQCRRCIWLNRMSTLEVNTPSRQQCVVSHLERNASGVLLRSLREAGYFMGVGDIDICDVLDPFENLLKNR